MIISISGPRPYKIGCQKIPGPVYNNICNKLKQNFLELKPEKVISGFAMGVDLWAASIAFNLKIPVFAAIPFKDQSASFDDDYKKLYDKLLSKCESIVLSPSYYNSVYQDRNIYMVDNSDLLISVYHDAIGKSGTLNCIEYAKSKNKQIININPFG